MGVLEWKRLDTSSWKHRGASSSWTRVLASIQWWEGCQHQRQVLLRCLDVLQPLMDYHTVDNFHIFLATATAWCWNGRENIWLITWVSMKWDRLISWVSVCAKGKWKYRLRVKWLHISRRQTSLLAQLNAIPTLPFSISAIPMNGS